MDDVLFSRRTRRSLFSASRARILSSRLLTVLRVSSRSVSMALIRPLRLSFETLANSRLRRMRFFSRAFLSSMADVGEDVEEAARFREFDGGLTETVGGVGTVGMTGGSRRRSMVGSMLEI